VVAEPSAPAPDSAVQAPAGADELLGLVSSLLRLVRRASSPPSFR
jgi:hypothetical protein